jgi:very-short-patch-repair endonuclease
VETIHKKQDYKILRFWGTELALYPEKCLQEIIKAIKESRQ